MEKTLYLPVWLATADRKSEIFRLIQRGPARGLLALTLHEAGKPGENFKPAGVLWYGGRKHGTGVIKTCTSEKVRQLLAKGLTIEETAKNLNKYADIAEQNYRSTSTGAPLASTYSNATKDSKTLVEAAVLAACPGRSYDRQHRLGTSLHAGRA